MHEGSRIGRAVVLVAAAVLGGAVALGGAASFGKLGHTTTVREVVNASEPSAPAAFAQDGRMSINEVFRRTSPGVVQVTTTSVQSVQPSLFDNPFGLPEQQTQRALGS